MPRSAAATPRPRRADGRPASSPIGVALAAAIAAAALPVSPASAQYTGLPFVVTPNQDSQVSATLIGVQARVDVGFPSDRLSEFTPLSGLAVLNWGRWSVTAGAGSLLHAELPDELTLGAGLGRDFTFRAPLMPTLTLQTAVGHTSFTADPDDLDRWDVPVGLGASLSFGPPDPAINVEPWLAPRGHVRSLEVAGGATETDLGFGVSAGLRAFTVDPDSRFNFGLQGAVDWLWIEDPAAGDVIAESTASVGVLVRWNTIRL